MKLRWWSLAISVVALWLLTHRAAYMRGAYDGWSSGVFHASNHYLDGGNNSIAWSDSAYRARFPARWWEK